MKNIDWWEAKDFAENTNPGNLIFTAHPEHGSPLGVSKGVQ